MNATCDNMTLDVILQFNVGNSLTNVIVLIVIWIVGVTGNGSILYLFLKEKKLRNVNNAFIVNLALGDFFLVIIYIPSLIFENYFFFRPFGKPFCVILNLCTYSSHDVSIMSLVVLSYIRYRAVVHPMENFAKHRFKRTVAACIAIWVIAVVGGIPPILNCRELCIHRFVKAHYIHLNDAVMAYHFARVVLNYGLPLAFISCVYVRMAVELLPGSSMLSRNNSISARRAARSRHRLGIITLALVAIFAVSWLPRHITTFVIFFRYGEGPISPLLTQVASACVALGSSLNPIAMYTASTMFRTYLKENIFFFCTPNTPQTETFHSRRLAMTFKRSTRNEPTNTDVQN